VVYGVASLAGGRAATYSCTPKPSRSTGAAVAAVGAVCVLAGLVWLVV
jgi:hypothetical protein